MHPIFATYKIFLSYSDANLQFIKPVKQIYGVGEVYEGTLSYALKLYGLVDSLSSFAYENAHRALFNRVHSDHIIDQVLNRHSIYITDWGLSG